MIASVIVGVYRLSKVGAAGGVDLGCKGTEHFHLEVRPVISRLKLELVAVSDGVVINVITDPLGALPRKEGQLVLIHLKYHIIIGRVNVIGSVG